MNNQAAQTMPLPAPKYKPEHGVYDESSLRAAFVYWENLMYLDSCGEDMTREQADDIGYRLKAVERAMEAHDHTINEDGEYVPVATLSQTAGVPEGWKLVPVEPTDTMLHCGSAAADGLGSPLARTKFAWKAMLIASPDAAAPAANGGEDSLPKLGSDRGMNWTPHVLQEVAAWHRRMNLELSGKGDQWAAREMWNCPHGRFATNLEVLCEQAAKHAQPPAGASASERARAIDSPIERLRKIRAACGELSAMVGDGPHREHMAIISGQASLAIEQLQREQALTQQRGEWTPLDIQTFARAYKAEVPHAVLTVHGIDAGLHALTRPTTPQPGAEALRELAQRWREDGSPYMDDCADELESLLGRGG